jgi:hypothetical protein
MLLNVWANITKAESEMALPFLFELGFQLKRDLLPILSRNTESRFEVIPVYLQFPLSELLITSGRR